MFPTPCTEFQIVKWPGIEICRADREALFSVLKQIQCEANMTGLVLRRAGSVLWKLWSRVQSCANLICRMDGVWIIRAKGNEGRDVTTFSKTLSGAKYIQYFHCIWLDGMQPSFYSSWRWSATALKRKIINILSLILNAVDACENTALLGFETIPRLWRAGECNGSKS